jgi:aubergine-like protein
MSAKGLMSICTKMVIQMNTKQGGEPWGINNPMKNIMVLGYDVHHAGLGGGISVGAMTATVNPSLGRYYSTIDRLPAERQEIATTVAKMFDKCLRAYAVRNGGQLPARLMMYRDGVGEGQLLDVKETEVTAMEEKIKIVYGEAKQAIPKFIYLIVNKRINTRLFQAHHGGSYNNPMPGLIVDDVVTRPERYDFFLVSQTARQGCVSPTYYNVIHDTSGLTPEQVQMFTYRLCHLYYNWSGTVAVPGPCQNAHKYALQAGTAIKGPAHKNLDYLLHFL